MRADLYFRISVIDAGLRLKSHLGRYSDITVVDAIRQLRAGPVSYSTLDYDSALELSQDDGLSLFYPSSNRIDELRQTILRMALKLKPFWATVSIYGRDRVSAVISADQAQCLRYAGLLNSTDEAVWKWWDQLASHFRSERSNRLLEIGRMGEQLTLQFEKATLRKLGIKESPRWISLEDNLAGYDILSYRLNEEGKVSKVFIEVKATTSTDLLFTLTRREWEFAQSVGASSKFHFWYLPEKTIRSAPIDEISFNIPTDNGSGLWDRVSLNLRNAAFVRAELSDDIVK